MNIKIKTNGIWKGKLNVSCDNKKPTGVDNSNVAEFNFYSNCDIEKNMILKFEGLGGQNLDLQIILDSEEGNKNE